MLPYVKIAYLGTLCRHDVFKTYDRGKNLANLLHYANCKRQDIQTTWKENESDYQSKANRAVTLQFLLYQVMEMTFWT